MSLLDDYYKSMTRQTPIAQQDPFANTRMSFQDPGRVSRETIAMGRNVDPIRPTMSGYEEGGREENAGPALPQAFASPQSPSGPGVPGAPPGGSPPGGGGMTLPPVNGPSWWDKLLPFLTLGATGMKVAGQLYPRGGAPEGPGMYNPVETGADIGMDEPGWEPPESWGTPAIRPIDTGGMYNPSETGADVGMDTLGWSPGSSTAGEMWNPSETGADYGMDEPGWTPPSSWGVPMPNAPGMPTGEAGDYIPEEGGMGVGDYLSAAGGYASDLLKAYGIYQNIASGNIAGVGQSLTMPAITKGAQALSTSAVEGGAAAGSAISSALPVVNIIGAVESVRQSGGDTEEQYKNRSADEQFLSSPGIQAPTGGLGYPLLKWAPDSPGAQWTENLGKLEDKYVGEVVDKTFGAGYSFASKLFGGSGSSNPATPMGAALQSVPTLEQVKQGITGNMGSYGTWNLNTPDMIYLKENADKVPQEVWNMDINQYTSWFREQLQTNPDVQKFYQDVRQYTDPYQASIPYGEEGYIGPNVTTFGAYNDQVGAYQPAQQALATPQYTNWWEDPMMTAP